MPTIRFTLDEEHAKLLEEDAQRAGQTVQDYIRLRLFPTTAGTVFTPQEAVRRALAKHKKGDRFTLPGVYGEDWTIPLGMAGAFGKKFFNYVSTPDSPIRFVGMTDHGRRAQYEIL